MSTDILSIDEVAGFLCEAANSLYSLAKCQAAPFVLLPDGDYRFIAENLADWIAEYRQGLRKQKKARRQQPRLTCEGGSAC